MFCDCDDSFYKVNSLYLMLKEISYYPDYDMFWPPFIIEGRDHRFEINVDSSITWIHGKAYRSKFLYENKIFWPEDLKVNEDNAYNTLIVSLYLSTKSCLRLLIRSISFSTSLRMSGF